MLAQMDKVMDEKMDARNKEMKEEIGARDDKMDARDVKINPTGEEMNEKWK
mgnify:CR=1 FL=1